MCPIHEVPTDLPKTRYPDKMICEDFKDELLDKLNELRETNILCDATIRTEGQDFAAHKCVLCAASAYFRALFTSQMKETKSNMVE